MGFSISHLLLISLGINFVFYLLAMRLKTDVFTDITYSSAIGLLALIQFGNTAPFSLYSLLLLTAILAWGIRLGSYLFSRIRRIQADHRFDRIRNSPLRFGIFWLVQALTVWVILLPSLGIFGEQRTQAEPMQIHALETFSIALAIVGLLIESIADRQKYRHKNRFPDQFMRTGLWKYSRHPNYFGELLFWWGLSLPGLELFSGVEFLYYLGPLFLTLLLLFATGIPPMERAWKKKWGEDPDFQSYLERTSALFLLPPKKR